LRSQKKAKVREWGGVLGRGSSLSLHQLRGLGNAVNFPAESVVEL